MFLTGKMILWQPAIPVLLSSVCLCHVTMAKAAPPNILIFLADDLGIGDLGIYGNGTLKTPNIDSIGKEGVILTHHISAGTMCTPSRAAFMTGRYPLRTGIEAGPIRVLTNLASSTGLPPWEITLGEQAKSAGYKTAIFGKWHLGVFDLYRNPVYHPLNQGFDVFYGIPYTNMDEFGEQSEKTCNVAKLFPQISVLFILFYLPVASLRHLNIIPLKVVIIIVSIFASLLLFVLHNLQNKCAFHSVLMRQFDVVEQPIRVEGLTKRLINESVHFMEQRKQDGGPFLVIMAWHLVKTVLEPMKHFKGRTNHGNYGDAIEELDWAVGEVLSALDTLGFRENTLVYFTSDHGAHIELAPSGNGGSMGPFRGGKAWGGVEGGYRVPGLIRWPNKLRAGSVIREPTQLVDIFSTVSQVIGASIPQDRHIDGHSLVPLLLNQTDTSPHEFIMHYCAGEIHAVTYRPSTKGTRIWKVAFRFPDSNVTPTDCAKHWPYNPHVCSCGCSRPRDPPLLFDLTSDPGEKSPYAESKEEYQDVVSRVNVAVDQHKLTLTSTNDVLTTYRTMWTPHLQLCCNFPFCSCKDAVYSDSD